MTREAAQLARIDAAIARANAQLAAKTPDPEAKLVVLGMNLPRSVRSGLPAYSREPETEDCSVPPPGLIASARLP